ncbi:hypothetical protein PT974_02831 [Cladobotryum mycophilum]|uniref:MYB DNA-binding domain-containing protein n=1 Tax=Cladobotryum mycophilum TaxID=491253 RepID=A0ABR0T0D7_9HYPO
MFRSLFPEKGFYQNWAVKHLPDNTHKNPWNLFQFATQPPVSTSFLPLLTKPLHRDAAREGDSLCQIIPILRIKVAAQSTLLWRDPCKKGTLAGHYRGSNYNVDYSGQDDEGEQSHLHDPYDQAALRQHHHSHHRASPHRPELTNTPPGPHLHHPIGQHHSHHMMMDQSPLSPHRMGSPQYGTHGSMIPIYQHHSAPHDAAGNPNHRPEELNLSVTGMDLDPSGLEGMHQVPMGTAYGHAASIAASQARPTHHHHHLPDLGMPSKMLLRDETGEGAPSMVGKEGMPAPAPRPRGPKLKFTPEDDQLLIELKEQKNLTWKQIADFFPGRSSGTLQVRYCTKLKAKTTHWTEEMDQKLRNALQNYENEKWRIIAHKVGGGFTPAACRDRAWELELQGEDPEELYRSIGAAEATPEAGEPSFQQ